MFIISENEVTVGKLNRVGIIRAATSDITCKNGSNGDVHYHSKEINQGSVRVRLLQKGCAIRDIVGNLFVRYVEGLQNEGVEGVDGIGDNYHCPDPGRKLSHRPLSLYYKSQSAKTAITSSQCCPCPAKALPASALVRSVTIQPKYCLVNV